MRLLYLDLSSLGLWDQRFLKLLENGAAPDTHVQVRHMQVAADSRQTPHLPDHPEEYYSTLLKSVRHAEEEGFDAVMLGCASEPGLRAARNAASIPVLGPLGAALHLGGLLGRRLCILCPAHDGHRTRPLVWHEDSLSLYGVSTDRVTFRLVEVQKPDPLWIDSLVEAGDLEGLHRQMVEIYRASIIDAGIIQAQCAATEDRAEVLFFACTLWAGLLGPVAEAVDMPVLDPVVTLLKATEAAVSAAGFCKERHPHSSDEEEEVVNT